MKVMGQLKCWSISDSECDILVIARQFGFNFSKLLLLMGILQRMLPE